MNEETNLQGSSVGGLAGPASNRCASAVAPDRSGGAGRPAADVTVAVCTHNRPQQLARLLAGIADELAGLGVEILVVDRSIKTNAARVVRDQVARYPNVRYCRTGVAGVSLARNVALAAATKTWLAFIDDDELPEPGWPEAMIALLRRLPPNCAGCGGNVVPAWRPQQAMPEIGRRWLGYLSMISQAGEFDQTAAPQFGIGHSVMRVDAIKAVGGFDLRLGRDGDSLMSGEEVLLLEQLVARGWRIWHSDRLSVQHTIDAERLERSWALRRAFWEGVSIGRVQSIMETRGFVWRMAALALRTLVLTMLHMCLGRRFELDLRCSLARGLFQESLAQMRIRREVQAGGRAEERSRSGSKQARDPDGAAGRRATSKRASA